MKHIIPKKFNRIQKTLIPYHSSHGMHSSLVARLNEEIAIALHEVLGHAHEHAVRKETIRMIPERLDIAEYVVPTATIETCRVLLQLVEDLVHLEDCRKRLDEHCRLDAATGYTCEILSPLEHRIP